MNWQMLIENEFLLDFLLMLSSLLIKIKDSQTIPIKNIKT